MDSTLGKYDPTTTATREVPRAFAEGKVNKGDIEQWTRESGGFDATPEFLAKFAALVASAEREACAKMLEAASKTGKIVSCTSAAKAIRERGQA